jgi:hypothetical protein
VSKGAIWKLEILVPSLIFVAFCCDVLGRFVSVEPIAFRSDEVMMQFASPFRMGPSEPNRRYHSDRINGDVASIGNLPEYRVFRPQTFTTDKNGFRNSSDPRRPPPSVLMLGSSFIAGSGNTDDQAIPARLEALSGCAVYNAAGLPVWADSILALAHDRGMNHGLVLIECLERAVGRPIVRSVSTRRLAWLPFREDLNFINQTLRARLSVSPFQLLFQRLYKSVQNDVILPNIYKDRVAVRHLQDGRPMLFLREIEGDRKFTGIRQYVDTYALLRDQLRAEGFDLALVIVPDKLTVYGPLLSDPPPGWREGEALLGEFERSARARDITVVNLAPALIAHARQALDASVTIYWTDDTHWNPRGIEVAAEVIVEALGLRARCGTAGVAPTETRRP